MSEQQEFSRGDHVSWSSHGMRLPEPRGPVSEGIVRALRHPPAASDPRTALPRAADPLRDEDLQLSLWTCYELHYRGFDGVDDRWEWDLRLLELRAQLEDLHERGLAAVASPPAEVDPDRVPAAITALVEADDGPSLTGYLLRHGTLEQFRDMVVHRSALQLKEADPHTWAIPRLGGRAKAALVEVQADEYGGGRPHAVHQELFRDAMRALDLADGYGHYIDELPAATLAVSNTVSLFGLHRRWLGAICGHLAAYEMTSSQPSRQLATALRRWGYGSAATRFFDEHVEADSVHDQIAAHDLCGTLAREQPGLARDILFGAACSQAMDRRFAEHLLDAWERGVSSRRPRTVVAA